MLFYLKKEKRTQIASEGKQLTEGSTNFLYTLKAGALHVHRRRRLFCVAIMLMDVCRPHRPKEEEEEEEVGKKGGSEERDDRLTG